MKNVVVYCRVSSEGASFEGQRELAEKYVDLHGCKIVEFYEDDGTAGAIPFEDRLEGAQLIKDAEDGKFEEVLTYKIDRLGRTEKVASNAINLLDNKGVKLTLMTEPTMRRTKQ